MKKKLSEVPMDAKIHIDGDNRTWIVKKWTGRDYQIETYYDDGSWMAGKWIPADTIVEVVEREYTKEEIDKIRKEGINTDQEDKTDWEEYMDTIAAKRIIEEWDKKHKDDPEEYNIERCICNHTAIDDGRCDGKGWGMCKKVEYNIEKTMGYNTEKIRKEDPLWYQQIVMDEEDNIKHEIRKYWQYWYMWFQEEIMKQYTLKEDEPYTSLEEILSGVGLSMIVGTNGARDWAIQKAYAKIAKMITDGYTLKQEEIKRREDGTGE